MRDERPTHLDLFSGIGGFALAAQWAGFRTIGFCEIDRYCHKVLAKNFLADTEFAGIGGRNQRGLGAGWSEVKESKNGADSTNESGNGSKIRIASDIFDLDGREFSGVSLITGGFPCQPFSVAGKRRGAADDRAIWPEMFRVISEARPAWVLGENVPGIIPMELDNVLSDLERIGYATRPFVIPACAVDARHRRDRLWIVCHAAEQGLQDGRSTSLGNAGGIFAEPQRPDSYREYRWLPEPNVGRVVDGLSLELDFARQITAHEHSHRSEKKSERNILVWKLLRKVWEHRELAAASPELYVQRLQDSVPEVPLRDSQSRWLLGSRIENREGLRDLWREFYAQGLASAQDLQFKLLEQARQVKREQTLGNRVNRLKGLGNAIVPQVAYQILKEIRKLI